MLGPDGKPLPGLPSAREIRSGLGDMSVSATLSPLPSDSTLVLNLTARVKIPTSSRSAGVSTGKMDFSGAVELSYLAGDFAPFASMGYNVPGKLAGANLRNSFSSSVGTSWISGSKAIIVSYDYDQAISQAARDGHSIFGAYSAPISKLVRATVFAQIGLSAGSPAIEGGVLLSVKI